MIPDTSAQDQTVINKKSPVHLWLKALIALVGFMLLAGWAFTQWADSTPSVKRDQVRISRLTLGDLVRDVSTSGQVVAGVSPILYASAKGTVSFHVRSGDQVSEGDMLANIDSPELQNQLRQEEAKLQRLQVEVKRQLIQNKKNSLLAKRLIDEAKVNLQAAEREYERNQLAWDKGVINEVEFLAAQDAVKNARIVHQYNIDEANLNLSTWEFEQQTRELELEQQSLLVNEMQRLVEGLTLRSPIKGMVGNLMVTEKSLVNQNAPLISVVDLTQLEIDAQIPELYADSLSLGLPVLIRHAGKEVEGKVTSVSPEVTQGQLSARVRFNQPLPSGLRQNQRMQIRILLEEHKDSLLLSRGPFIEEGAGRIAYVVEGDYAVRTRITAGATSISHVQILSGLEKDAQVVISSYETFNNAERVRLR